MSCACILLSSFHDDSILFCSTCSQMEAVPSSLPQWDGVRTHCLLVFCLAYQGNAPMPLYLSRGTCSHVLRSLIPFDTLQLTMCNSIRCSNDSANGCITQPLTW